MNSGTPISGAFRAIFWRFPTRVPQPPNSTESELALRDGTQQLLDRYVTAAESPLFRELVDKHRVKICAAEPGAGLDPLVRSVMLALAELGP